MTGTLISFAVLFLLHALITFPLLAPVHVPMHTHVLCFQTLVVDAEACSQRVRPQPLTLTLCSD